MQFAYITDTQEVTVILTAIYNLLLTIFYWEIIKTGRQVIIRNLRKGRDKGGLTN